jgi:two-component system chemotaxis response regulator CheY
MSHSVLYIEDDPMSRRVLEFLLKKDLGYEHVTIFKDSHNLMERVLEIDPIPTLIFLDIHVRPIDGFGMLKELRQHPHFQDATIIALTASVMNDEIALLRQAGFNGLIAKPINQRIFAHSLDKILRGEPEWRVF